MKDIPTILPDGSNYRQLILEAEDQNNFIDQLSLIVEQLIKGLELRVLFPNVSQAESYIHQITKTNLQISHGKTNYFEVAPDEINSYIARFEKAITGFNLKKVTRSSREIEDLMVNSFAWDFNRNELNMIKAEHIRNSIESGFKQPGNNIFVIEHIESGNLLGTFTHIDLGDEVQGHSAAGRPIGELSKLKGKLEIILYFSLLSNRNNYPGIPHTFNSSGAAKLYEKLGVKQSNRYGVVIRKN